MNKIKLLMPVMLSATIAAPLMSMTGCNSTVGNKPYIEPYENITIQCSNVELNKDITVTCSPKDGYEIDKSNILIKIDGKVITKDTNGYVIKDNVITISGDVVTSTNVYINVPVVAKIETIDFATCTWTQVVEAANLGSDYCVRRFGVDKIEDMIGKTKTISVKNNAGGSSTEARTDLTVRIIDVNHDTYFDEDTLEFKQAVFTFEFVDCIDTGFVWGTNTTAYADPLSYIESNIFKHLNNIDTAGGIYTRFQDDVLAGVKPVIKSFTYFNPHNRAAKLYTCSMGFFSLSAVELGITQEEIEAENFDVFDEGWVYDYYKNAKSDPTIRQKKLFKNSTKKTDEPVNYHTRTIALTPLDEGITTWHMWTCASGSWGEPFETTEGAIDVAFCI